MQESRGAYVAQQKQIARVGLKLVQSKTGLLRAGQRQLFGPLISGDPLDPGKPPDNGELPAHFARLQVVIKGGKAEPRPRRFHHTAHAPEAGFYKEQLTVQFLSNLMGLAQEGFLDGKAFHRVVPNFVIQGGSPSGDAYGSLDYSIRSEFSAIHYDREGLLGMASAGPDTEGTQFFITHSPTLHLDGRYTVFGRVVSGMDAVHDVQVGDRIVEATPQAAE